MTSVRRCLLVLVAAALLTAGIGPATAGHRRSSWCSPSGDYCIETFEKDGVRKFEIRMAAKYFSRYKLCVTAPDDSTECRRFRVRDRGDIYGDVVAWRSFFPRKGTGAYDVRWTYSAGNLGPWLGFHI